MYEERLESLLESWKNSFGQYHLLKSEAEGAVIRWEWATRERYSALPFHFERFPGRGKVLKNGPASMGNFIHYGFDDQGRVRLHRSCQLRSLEPAGSMEAWALQPPAEQDLYSETFYRYSDGLLESIEYSVPPHIPLSLQQIFFENHRVTFYTCFRLNGYTPLYGKKGKDPEALYEWLGYNGRFKTAEEYVYEDNRLRMIAGYYEFPGIPPSSAREVFAYDDAGKLLRIDRVWEGGEKQAVYRKRLQGQTFQSIREEITQRLIATIIQRLKAANIREKIYCILLNYQKDKQHFPPIILPVPESYRLEAIRSSDPEARYQIFSPLPDQEWFFEIDDPQALEICQIMEQEIRAGEKGETATSILRDIAAALTRQDWSNLLDVTPDFVVFALDPELEGDQIIEALSSSVPSEQIQAWKAEGWLD